MMTAPHSKVYRFITILAMLAMPLAAAISFGDAAHDALLERVAPWLAAVGGISAGVGFEALGILAGHLAVALYLQKRRMVLVPSAVLLAYVAVGVVEMHAIPFARFLPALAAMVYVIAGLQGENETATLAQVEETAEARAHERKMEIARMKLEHEEKMRAQELDAQKKIEQAKARAAAKSGRASQKRSQKVRSAPAKMYECACERVFEGSRSYNAHRKTCKVPADAPTKIYTNGVAE